MTKKASKKKRYWLFKSEPNAFSFEDLKKMPRKTDHWDGVRNYQARNFMRDEVSVGDSVLFYHSSCKEPGVVGLAEVTREAYPDHTAWDPKSHYYDPKSTADNPRWFMVDITYKWKFSTMVTLKAIKANPALATMKLVQRGQRLSVQPVSREAFETILKMAEKSL